MAGVRAWLESLGLGRYAEAFERHEIGTDLVDQLDHDTLREIGVATLGHRLRILRAAAQAQAEPSRATEPAPAAAERRNLTILFCDLVGSTALSTRLDPEDYREVLGAYHRAVTEAAGRAGGHMAQFLGDGALVYFGYPAAQEDAAERAVRMALDLREATRRIEVEPGGGLEVRVGVATGLVVIGERGPSPAEDAMALGETPNLAARLQGAAAPGEVLVSEATRRLVGQAFRLEPLPARDLKGFPEPVPAWRVAGPGFTEDRFDARAAGRLAPCLGRERELAALRAAWGDAAGGAGAVFMLRAEAGMGKSRLVRELAAGEGGPARELRLQCAPQHSTAMLHPVRRMLAREAGFRPEDDARARLDKLQELLGEAPGGVEARTLIAGLLELPLDSFPPLGLSPELRRRRLLEALTELLVARLSGEGPALAVFEDLHWADPTTLELIGALAAAAADRPALILLTFRPEFVPPWTGLPRAELCDLHPLGAEATERLIAHVAGGEAIAPELRAVLADRSGGVPLFVEELAKAVVEARAAGGEAALAGEVPLTLLDTLMARIDRLAEARHVAQTGAAIGREFDEDLLAAVSEAGGEAVRSGLARLAEADLASPAGESGRWMFRHALIRDAAYRSLTRRSRRALNGRIARALLERGRAGGEAAPELVARHFDEAAEPGAAAAQWLSAGRRAWRRTAVKEARARLEQGIESVAAMAPGDARDALELQLRLTLGLVQLAGVSYGSPEAEAAFARARELSRSVRDPEVLVPFHLGFGAVQVMQGHAEAGHAELARMVEAAGEDPRLGVYAASMMTWSHFNRAAFAEAVRWGERVEALVEAHGWDPRGARLSTSDPVVVARCFAAAAHWALGRSERAERLAASALVYARALPFDPYSVDYARVNGVCRIAELCGRWDRLLQEADRAIEASRRGGYEFAAGFTLFYRGRALDALGRSAEAAEAISASLESSRSMGVRYHAPHFRGALAAALARAGRTAEAETALEGLEAEVEESGELWQRADVRVARARACEALDRPEEAEAAWRSAAEAAEAIGSAAFHLRASAGLARHLAARGEAASARDVLAASRAALPEEARTEDLAEADDLLGRLLA